MSENATVERLDGADERRPYIRPELHVYGAITRLVQGGSGISFEGSSGMIGMM